MWCAESNFGENVVYNIVYNTVSYTAYRLHTICK